MICFDFNLQRVGKIVARFSLQALDNDLASIIAIGDAVSMPFHCCPSSTNQSECLLQWAKVQRSCTIAIIYSPTMLMQLPGKDVWKGAGKILRFILQIFVFWSSC